MYNMNQKFRFSPIYLKSGLTRNNKRYQEFPYFLRRKGNHTLWWIVSNPQVSSKAKTKAILQNYVRFCQQHIKYHASELILFILYYIIAGILRIDTTRPLQFNGVFKRLLGVKTFPNPTTIRRFLHKLSPKVIRQIVKVHNLLQQKLFFIHSA